MRFVELAVSFVVDKCVSTSKMLEFPSKEIFCHIVLGTSPK